MNAGKLRQRITLQQPVVGSNAIGEETYTWADVATVWGSMEPATGSWYFSGRQADSKVDGRVRIRYRSDILPTWRIKFGDRYLSIVSILNPQERNRETVIMYTESLD
jgi:SPP1 family predicted phage head-tail adaptor